MKPLYIFCMMSLFSGKLLTAQITKGSVLFGGSLSYSSEKTDNNSNTKIKSTGFAPAFGVAIRENLVAGADLEYYSIDSDYDYLKNEAKGAGVFLRKYWNIGKKFYAFGQARIGVRWADYIYTDTRYAYMRWNVEEFNTNITLKPGFAFTLSKKVQLETVLLPLFTAQYRKTESNSDTFSSNKQHKENKGFDVNTSFSSNTSFALGIRVLLGK